MKPKNVFYGTKCLCIYNALQTCILRLLSCQARKIPFCAVRVHVDTLDSTLRSMDRINTSQTHYIMSTTLVGSRSCTVHRRIVFVLLSLVGRLSGLYVEDYDCSSLAHTFSSSSCPSSSEHKLGFDFDGGRTRLEFQVVWAYTFTTASILHGIHCVTVATAMSL